MYRYVILDHDSNFNTDDHHTESNRIRTEADERSGTLAKWNRGALGRSCRREILDHVIALNKPHLRRLIRDYVNYYHEDRIHDSLAKDCPNHRQVEQRPSATAIVIASQQLGGLHHHYYWRPAA